MTQHVDTKQDACIHIQACRALCDCCNCPTLCFENIHKKSANQKHGKHMCAALRPTPKKHIAELQLHVLQGMFSSIPESVFRSDISSTELREKLAQQQTTT